MKLGEISLGEYLAYIVLALVVLAAGIIIGIGIGRYG